MHNMQPTEYGQTKVNVSEVLAASIINPDDGGSKYP
jgi:hypothetical protein